MRRSSLALAAALGMAALPALADEPRSRRVEVSNELAVGTSPPTPTSPRTTQVSAALDGLFEVGGGLSLTASLVALSPRPIAEVPGQQYATKGSTVWTLGAGLVWEIGDHLTLDASGHVSPESELQADSAVTWVTAAGPVSVDALLKSHASSAGGTLAMSYDTAGDSAAETAVDLGVSLEQYATDQKVVEIRGPRVGSLTAADIQNLCRLRPALCPKQLVGALRGKPASLSQVALQVAVTETLWRDTDLGLAAGVYGYDKDPTEVGYFTLAGGGRAGASFGGGVALAPLQWTIRPSLSQRLGDWTLRLAWQHGTYVSGEGTLDALTARVQLRITRAFRMWATVLGQRDRDGEGNTATTRSLALGALYRW